MNTLRQKLNALPAARRKKIVKRTDALVAEENAMREMREQGAGVSCGKAR